ncbi:hypothetical protein [Microcoleus sp. B4-C1]|uniref:hypothetical protein n=1 Tax=Microcoleus sp. B4-C1 TaxID=2818660 RepID=UPI002FD4F356
MANRYRRGDAFTAAPAGWDLNSVLTHKTNKLSSNKGLKCELNPYWITLLEPEFPPFLGFFRTKRTLEREI